MRQAIVIGAGGHCRAVISILLDVARYTKISILDLNKKKPGEFIMGVPVLLESTSVLQSYFGRSDLDIFLAIGDNLLRREWWERVNKLQLQLPNLISPSANIDSYARLGRGNVICPKVFIGPESRIGDNNLINTGAIVEHEVKVGNHCHLGPSSTIAGRVTISDSCFIGAGSTVIDNLSLAPSTALGAGAVLVSVVEDPDGLYVGVPAKKIRKHL